MKKDVNNNSKKELKEVKAERINNKFEDSKVSVKKTSDVKKTGRTFSKISEILEQLKEEKDDTKMVESEENK